MTASDFRDQTTAAYKARRELGPEYEQAVLDSFVAGAAESIDQRVDARLAQVGVRASTPRWHAQPDGRQEEDNSHLAVPVFSLLFGFVSTVILAAMGADPGFAFVMWVGTAVINKVHRGRRKPR